MEITHFLLIDAKRTKFRDVHKYEIVFTRTHISVIFVFSV